MTEWARQAETGPVTRRGLEHEAEEVLRKVFEARLREWHSPGNPPPTAFWSSTTYVVARANNTWRSLRWVPYRKGTDPKLGRGRWQQANEHGWTNNSPGPRPDEAWAIEKDIAVLDNKEPPAGSTWRIRSGSWWRTVSWVTRCEGGTVVHWTDPDGRAAAPIDSWTAWVLTNNARTAADTPATQGASAYNCGRALVQCPYPDAGKGKPLAAEWMRGWQDAREQARTGKGPTAEWWLLSITGDGFGVGSDGKMTKDPASLATFNAESSAKREQAHGMTGLRWVPTPRPNADWEEDRAWECANRALASKYNLSEEACLSEFFPLPKADAIGLGPSEWVFKGSSVGVKFAWNEETDAVRTDGRADWKERIRLIMRNASDLAA